jgi:excisionase family DNA binding protein
MSTIHDHSSRPCADRLNGVQLLTMHEAASRMGVGLRMVRRLTSERRLAFVKVGKYVRIPSSAVEGFIKAGYMPALCTPQHRGGRGQAYDVRPEAAVVSP